MEDLKCQAKEFALNSTANQDPLLDFGEMTRSKTNMRRSLDSRADGRAHNGLEIACEIGSGLRQQLRARKGGQSGNNCFQLGSLQAKPEAQVPGQVVYQRCCPQEKPVRKWGERTEKRASFQGKCQSSLDSTAGPGAQIPAQNLLCLQLSKLGFHTSLSASDQLQATPG